MDGNVNLVNDDLNENSINENTDKIIIDMLEGNPNLSFEQRKFIYDGVINISKFLNIYDVHLDLASIVDTGILSSFKLVDVQESDSYYSYFKENNTLTRKKTNDEYMIYDFYESLLRMMSQRYDSSVQKYQSGLLFEDEIKTHNSVLNEELISRLTTLITGYNDRKRKDFIDSIDGTCIRDVVMKDMEEIVGIQNIVNKFITANGDGLFDEISEKIGVEQAMDFISILDKSVETTDIDHKDAIENRRKYDMYIKLLKDLSLESIHKM